MRRTFLIGLLWLAGQGCSRSQSTVVLTGPKAADAAPTADGAPPVQTKTPEDKTTVAEGPLELRAAVPFVQGWALSQAEMSERFGDEWVKRLATRRLRVQGFTEVYSCPPAQGCLADGKLPMFKIVKELSLVCADGRSLVVPKLCPSPRCLRDCDTRVMTRHDACGRNGGPNWPSWCADSNHEMRQNCESTCASECPAGSGRPSWCD